MHASQKPAQRGEDVKEPLLDEASVESGRDTPRGAPSEDVYKPGPDRGETVGDGRPTERWDESTPTRKVQKGA